MGGVRSGAWLGSGSVGYRNVCTQAVALGARYAVTVGARRVMAVTGSLLAAAAGWAGSGAVHGGGQGRWDAATWLRRLLRWEVRAGVTLSPQR